MKVTLTVMSGVIWTFRKGCRAPDWDCFNVGSFEKFDRRRDRIEVFCSIPTLGDDFCDRNMSFFWFDFVELANETFPETTWDRFLLVLITTVFFGAMRSRLLRFLSLVGVWSLRWLQLFGLRSLCSVWIVLNYFPLLLISSTKIGEPSFFTDACFFRSSLSASSASRLIAWLFAMSCLLTIALMLEALCWIKLVIPMFSGGLPLAEDDLGGLLKLFIRFYCSTMRANCMFILFMVSLTIVDIFNY